MLVSVKINNKKLLKNIKCRELSQVISLRYTYKVQCAIGDGNTQHYDSILVSVLSFRIVTQYELKSETEITQVVSDPLRL